MDLIEKKPWHKSTCRSVTSLLHSDLIRLPATIMHYFNQELEAFTTKINTDLPSKDDIYLTWAVSSSLINHCSLYTGAYAINHDRSFVASR